MPVELFRQGSHRCVMFQDLVEDDIGGVQSNQFLIADNDQVAAIDPGGIITYNAFYMAKQSLFPNTKIEYVIASHADPDVISSLNKWLVQTGCKAIVPKLWARFIPHFCTDQKAVGRVISVPDKGGDIPLGNSVIKAIPAHFLHSEGNFHFYDPVSKILFSGDLGASMGPKEDLAKPVTDLAGHLRHIEGFHRRYMNSNRVCRFWAHMVRKLEISMIVPQHGRIYQGPAVGQLIDWIEQLECGVDLMTQDHYRVP